MKDGDGMLPEAWKLPAGGLFGLCVAAAAMDALTRDGRAALSFRALCALCCALCAARLVVGLFA